MQSKYVDMQDHLGWVCELAWKANRSPEQNVMPGCLSADTYDVEADALKGSDAMFYFSAPKAGTRIGGRKAVQRGAVWGEHEQWCDFVAGWFGLWHAMTFVHSTAQL